MTREKFAVFDASEFLDSEEAINDYLAIALEDYDAKTFQSVLGTIARARGMTELSRKTGLGRESLYKALSPQGNPSFENICKIMKALDLKLTTAMPLDK